MIDVGGPKLFACDEFRTARTRHKPYRIHNGQIETRHTLGVQWRVPSCVQAAPQCGYCEDAWADPPKQPKKGKRKTGRAYRRQMRVQKLNREIDIAHHGGGNTMFMGFGLDKRGLPASNVWGLWMLGIDDDDAPRVYVKKPRSSKSRRFYKNRSNRILRRKCVVLPKGNQHHKYFEYWWTFL